MAKTLGRASPDDITFDDFVGIVCDTPDERRDFHWRSQWMLTLSDVLDYHFVVRMDRFVEDMQSVLAAIGAPPLEADFLGRRWKDSGSAELAIPAETERKIRNEFAKDYEIRATAGLAEGVRAA
jgi:hypothetical protein